MEFRNDGFWGEGKTSQECLEKNLSEQGWDPTTNSTHMTPSTGIEPVRHWWEASAHTTVPSLLPKTIVKIDTQTKMAQKLPVYPGGTYWYNSVLTTPIVVNKYSIFFQECFGCAKMPLKRRSANISCECDSPVELPRWQS